MQTYVFLVAVTGEDPQDAAGEIRDSVIGLASLVLGDLEGVTDVHVGESTRVTPGN